MHRGTSHLVLAVRFAVVGGADGEDDDHDEQRSTGGQDGYQGLVICWFLLDQKREEMSPGAETLERSHAQTILTLVVSSKYWFARLVFTAGHIRRY